MPRFSSFGRIMSVIEPSANAPETTPPAIRLVKRYSNRKLYDTKKSRYVTLDDISVMIRAGEDVRVIDNESKDDLTTVTLTQIIYEEEKKHSRMPLSVLRNMINSSGTTLQDFIKTPVDDIRTSTQKSVEGLKQNAQSWKDAATRSVTGWTDSARKLFGWQERQQQEFTQTTQTLFAQLIERIDLHKKDVASAEDAGESPSLLKTELPRTLEELKGRIGDLGQRVDELARHLDFRKNAQGM